VLIGDKWCSGSYCNPVDYCHGADWHQAIDPLIEEKRLSSDSLKSGDLPVLPYALQHTLCGQMPPDRASTNSTAFDVDEIEVFQVTWSHLSKLNWMPLATPAA